jgi:hypothetical protein
MSKSAEQIRSNSRSPFGLPLVSQLKTQMKVYASKFAAGERSVKVLEVTVPIESCGLMIVSSIYGNYKPTTTGHEISYSATVPKNTYFESDDQRNDFIATAELAATRSSGWARLEAQADALLMGVEAPKRENRIERPRLVKTVAITTTATAAPHSEPVAASA